MIVGNFSQATVTIVNDDINGTSIMSMIIDTILYTANIQGGKLSQFSWFFTLQMFYNK